MSNGNEINRLNELFVPPLQRYIHSLSGQLYYYCMDNANIVKQVAHKLKKQRVNPPSDITDEFIEKICVPECQKEDLMAQYTINGQDFTSICSGLNQIVRNWFSKKGDFIMSKHAIGLGIDLEKHLGYTTVYVVARFF